MPIRYRLYKIFDVCLKSNIAIPELLTLNTSNLPANDLLFTLQPSTNQPFKPHNWIHHWRTLDGSISLSCAKDENNYWLSFPHTADFQISPQGKIDCFPNIKAEKNIITHLLLDQVIPRVMSHVGRPVVHASAISYNNQGIIFMGRTGWGKSTLAAHLYNLGNTLLTDDAILLEFLDNQLVGVPGYSSLRLNPDSFNNINLPISDTMTSSQCGIKRRISQPFQRDQNPKGIPIKAIFILGDPKVPSSNNSVVISPIKGSNAVIQLLDHTFPLDIFDRQYLSNTLSLFSCIFNMLPKSIFHLNYIRDYSILDEVTKKIDTCLKSKSLEKKINL